MYNPPAFREDRLEILHAAIRSHPLGTLVTAGASGLIANLVPFALHSGPDGDVLRAHLAKANGQLADLGSGAPALVLFRGPQAYVTPSWYATKREHGRVVPTWNYVMVQVRGTPKTTDDPTWLRATLESLTARHEGSRPDPWSIDDAPPDHVAGQLRGIVGLEIPCDRIEGKWKVSQNQPAVNIGGIVSGLRAEGHEQLADQVDRAG